MAKGAHRTSSPREAKEYEEEVIQISRVTRVVAGGRRLRFRATVAIGNKKGKVGLGTGKAAEVVISIQKAILQAKKNLINVPLWKETIPHEIRVKSGSARLLLIPAGPGTGIIAGGPARKILELAGVKNILAKCFGSTNKLNNSYATMEALRSLKSIPVKVQQTPVKPKMEKEAGAAMESAAPDAAQENSAQETQHS
ncbi:30S ribosomal protein S5 [Candidatus Peregrinibacteria bacterium]|nr:30S ribosomal protein S5 [Candidatus Peregrinibacteria bacterium]